MGIYDLNIHAPEAVMNTRDYGKNKLNLTWILINI